MFKESLFGAMGHCGAALPTYEAQKHRLKKKKARRSYEEFAQDITLI